MGYCKLNNSRTGTAIEFGFSSLYRQDRDTYGYMRERIFQLVWRGYQAKLCKTAVSKAEDMMYFWFQLVNLIHKSLLYNSTQTAGFCDVPLECYSLWEKHMKIGFSAPKPWFYARWTFRIDDHICFWPRWSSSQCLFCFIVGIEFIFSRSGLI